MRFGRFSGRPSAISAPANTSRAPLCALTIFWLCALAGPASCWFIPFSLARAEDSAGSAAALDITVSNDTTAAPRDGRLFVVFASTPDPDPRLQLGRPGRDAPEALALDLRLFGAGMAARVSPTAFAFPHPNLGRLPAGDYFVQAVFDADTDLRSPNAPGNLYSDPRPVRVPGVDSGMGTEPRLRLDLHLTRQIPPERLPPDTAQTRFVKIRSKLLSQFFGRPIYLRAGVLLPRDFDRDPTRRYPLWVRIGGLNTRYDIIAHDLMDPESDFGKTWFAEDTPRLLMLQLDGAGPNGDPYQVNSANNGPYGDAVIRELIPEIETRFRAVGKPAARFLSGTSTGGWVCLALQIFYPDFFNGAWSSSPDPVDFRAFELINIYADTNAYVNNHGHERPSERDRLGDVVLTMRQEVGVENLLGRGDSFTRSGQQWGEWNAVFGPRGADGLPVPLWDPRNGAINPAVAQTWKSYDLRCVLDQNWKNIGPKLKGKLHIAAGEADQYFLNNAVHLLDDFLRQTDPSFERTMVYGSRQTHGWMDISLREMLTQMARAAQRAEP